MKEAERCKEGSITYVWFECAKADCNGQWWQSYINQMSVLFENAVVCGTGKEECKPIEK
jgi:hypothetical protein